MTVMNKTHKKETLFHSWLWKGRYSWDWDLSNYFLQKGQGLFFTFQFRIAWKKFGLDRETSSVWDRKWSRTVVSDSLWPHGLPGGLPGYQAPPSMGFSRQKYWSGLPSPSPGDLPDPGIEPRSPTLQADAITSEPPGLRWCHLKVCPKVESF